MITFVELFMSVNLHCTYVSARLRHSRLVCCRLVELKLVVTVVSVANRATKKHNGNGISWAICKSAPCSRQITTPAPHHSVFYRLVLPAAQPAVSKH